MKRTGEAKAREALAFFVRDAGYHRPKRRIEFGPGRSGQEPERKVHGATGRKVIED